MSCVSHGLTIDVSASAPDAGSSFTYNMGGAKQPPAPLEDAIGALLEAGEPYFRDAGVPWPP